MILLEVMFKVQMETSSFQLLYCLFPNGDARLSQCVARARLLMARSDLALTIFCGTRKHSHRCSTECLFVKILRRLSFLEHLATSVRDIEVEEPV